MKLKNYLWEFIIVGILGTLSHFVYEWSGNSFTLGLFFPVNESTWEHLKLLFYPTVIYTAAEYFICKPENKSYIPASLLSLLCGMAAIVVLFYTYSGVLGKNLDFLNIAIFFIGIAVMLALKQLLLKRNFLKDDFLRAVSLFGVVFIGILFAVWSYSPPSLGIFLPPAV